AVSGLPPGRFPSIFADFSLRRGCGVSVLSGIVGVLQQVLQPVAGSSAWLPRLRLPLTPRAHRVAARHPGRAAFRAVTTPVRVGATVEQVELTAARAECRARRPADDLHERDPERPEQGIAPEADLWLARPPMKRQSDPALPQPL